MNAADLYEWTGNYSAGYEWNAWYKYWDSSVGIQWPYVGDERLWFHEAAHHFGYGSEGAAWARTYHCLTIP
jgi:hypothetical protein